MKQSANADGRVLLGALLVGAGLILLVLRYFDRSAELLWPLFIIVPGIVLMGSGIFSEWRSKNMAVAGAVVTAVGCILFAQSVFDYFQSWAYAWTLLPLAGGIGALLYGYQHGDQAAVEGGRATIRWAVIAFAGFGAAFELLFFQNRVAEAGIVLPILLIGVGGLLLMRRRELSAAESGPPVAAAADSLHDAAGNASASEKPSETPAAAKPASKGLLD